MRVKQPDAKKECELRSVSHESETWSRKNFIYRPLRLLLSQKPPSSLPFLLFDSYFHRNLPPPIPASAPSQPLLIKHCPRRIIQSRRLPVKCPPSRPSPSLLSAWAEQVELGFPDTRTLPLPPHPTSIHSTLRHSSQACN